MDLRIEMDPARRKRTSPAVNGHPERDGLDGARSEFISSAREFLNYLRVERALSPNTLDAYRRTMTRYIEYLHSLGVSKPSMIERQHVESFISALKSKEGWGLSGGSLAQALSALRSYHRFMLSEGYSTDDPTTLLPTPRTPGRVPRVLSVEQVESILNAPPGDGHGLRDRAILEVLYATGMRVSELVSLDLESVDIEQRLIRCIGKGGKFRLIPFGSEARDALEEYLVNSRPLLAKEKRTNALFLNARGRRLTRQGCWKIIRKYAREVGIEDQVSPHVFRHSFATHMLENGANLVVVQELLGHSSVSTTQIYTHVTRTHIRAVYESSHPRA